MAKKKSAAKKGASAPDKPTGWSAVFYRADDTTKRGYSKVGETTVPEPDAADALDLILAGLRKLSAQDRALFHRIQMEAVRTSSGADLSGMVAKAKGA